VLGATSSSNNVVLIVVITMAVVVVVFVVLVVFLLTRGRKKRAALEQTAWAAAQRMGPSPVFYPPPVGPTPGPPAPPPARPGGWHPDPHGRFAQRWFDGTRWSAHVASADGTESVDALG
jgi:hypothetical protein